MNAARTIHIVDDEPVVRASTVSLIQARGAVRCREYGTAEEFLGALGEIEPGCVVLDLQLDMLSGHAVMQALARLQDRFRMIVVTGFSDLAFAIDAFRAGAIEFIHKPYDRHALLDAIDRAFHLLDHGGEPPALVEQARSRIARLSHEEAEVLGALVAGSTNQDIARARDISPRAVQVIRARALAALEAPSLLAAIRMAIIAGWSPLGDDLSAAGEGGWPGVRGNP